MLSMSIIPVFLLLLSKKKTLSSPGVCLKRSVKGYLEFERFLPISKYMILLLTCDLSDCQVFEF